MTHVRRIPHVTQGNPMWPLPPDYLELSAEGQRLARVNGTRQYLLDWGPENDRIAQQHQKSLVWVDCLNFFDKYYLRPDPERNFDPQFYDISVPNGPIHDRLAYLGMRHRSLLAVFPRGTAKTTETKRELLCKGITWPGWSTLYSSSNHQHCSRVSESLRIQVISNDRIVRDWSRETHDGRLMPKRGEGSFNNTMFRLGNGSLYSFFSIDSKQRGGRPLEYVLDDVEADARASTDMEILRELLDERITKVVLPMLQRPLTRFRMLATLVSQQHYTTRLVSDLLGYQDFEDMADHPTRRWHRIVMPIDGDGGRSIWPHMFPTDEAEKQALNLHPETKTFDEIRADVGEAAWMSEYKCRPGAAKTRSFKLDPDNNFYWTEDVDDLLINDPINSSALLCWNRDGEVRRERIGELLRRGGTLIIGDTAFTDTATADFKVTHLVYRSERGELFSLDIRDTKLPKPTFYKMIFQQAAHWVCPVVWPEFVSSQADFYLDLNAMVRENLVRNMGIRHTPTIRPLKLGNTPKTSRIATLSTWFEHGLIKLPKRGCPLRSEAHERLIRQIDGFNPAADDGGLPNDDHLDTLASVLLTLKNRGEDSPVVEQVLTEPERIWARLEAGERTDEHGFPLISYLPSNMQMAATVRFGTALGDSPNASESETCV